MLKQTKSDKCLYQSPQQKSDFFKRIAVPSKINWTFIFLD